MNLLQLNNVSFTFSGASKPVLQHIHYHVQKNDFIILLGHNGSGKSSLLKLLYHPHQAYAGHIQLGDKSLTQYTTTELSKEIALLNQDCTQSLFPNLTIYENYLLIKQRVLLSRIVPQRERAALRDYLAIYHRPLSHKIDSAISHLSGGERQALALVFCLLNPPTLLLLDEHTSALDPKTSAHIMQLTHELTSKHNITCIITTHDLDLALRYGNRIILLRDGEISKTFDHAEKINLTKEQLISHYY